MDYSPPGYSVLGLLPARIVEWVAIPFSRGSSQHGDQTQVSHTAGIFFTIWATKIMIASKTELLKIPSCSVFWKRLGNIATSYLND